MSIFIVSDHAGFELKSKVIDQLSELNIIDLSPNYEAGDDYPEVAKLLASKLGKEDFGIAICGTGQGICIGLNRFKGVRAAVLNEINTAKIVRQHNHANVICLAGRELSIEKAVELIRVFLQTLPDSDQRHTRRIEQLDNLN